MKKLLLLLLCLCAMHQSQAQTDAQLEAMMIRRIPSCDDIQLNLMQLLPELYKKGDTGIINSMLKYADRKCTYKQPALTFKVLYAIENDTFILADYNPYDLYAELEYYQKSIRQNDSQYTRLKHYMSAFDAPTVDTYYSFARMLAGSMSGRTFKTDFEKKIVDFYINPSDSLLKVIDKSTSDRRINTEYHRRHGTRDNRNGGLHMSLFTGVWMPQGNLSVVGNHPYIGFQYGGGSRKFQISLTIAGRFINAADSFNVLKADSLYRSKHYGGAYFGLDGNYALVSGKKHELSLVGGIGLETLKTLSVEQKDDDDDISKRIYTPNINLGLGYKYWFYAAYVGLDLKYNVLFFRNKGGTDFSGNAFTLSVAIGFVSL